MWMFCLFQRMFSAVCAASGVLCVCGMVYVVLISAVCVVLRVACHVRSACFVQCAVRCVVLLHAAYGVLCVPGRWGKG